MIRVAIIGIVGNSVFLPVEHFHAGGETVVASDMHTEWGGKGYNQAIAAARHGAKVSFLGTVGERDVSAVLADASVRGIDAQLVVSKEEGSPFAVIMTDASGANHVTVYRGAQLQASDVARFANEIARADVLLLSNEVSEEVNLAALRVAKKSGVRVILNPAPARPLCEEMLSGVSLFTPNEHETDGLEQYKNVIVTLGARGCFLRETNERVPTANAGSVVDTTGAGDTFNGVLAVALAEGNTQKRACELANAAAAIKVTRRFVAEAIPQKEQTLHVWEKNYGQNVF